MLSKVVRFLQRQGSWFTIKAFRNSWTSLTNVPLLTSIFTHKKGKKFCAIHHPKNWEGGPSQTYTRMYMLGIHIFPEKWRLRRLWRLLSYTWVNTVLNTANVANIIFSLLARSHLSPQSLHKMYMIKSNDSACSLKW